MPQPIFRRFTRAGLGALGLLAVLAVLAVPASTSASASVSASKAKTFTIGNHTEITVAAGWVAGKVKGDKLGISHVSPKAIIEVAVAKGETGSVAANGMANLQGFASGFGLTNVKTTLQQTAKIPGGGKFNQAASITYTGTYLGHTLGGLVVEYQNTKTTDGAFAIVVAQQSGKPKLKKAVNEMFRSIATNP